MPSGQQQSRESNRDPAHQGCSRVAHTLRACCVVFLCLVFILLMLSSVIWPCSLLCPLTFLPLLPGLLIGNSCVWCVVVSASLMSAYTCNLVPTCVRGDRAGQGGQLLHRILQEAHYHQRLHASSIKAPRMMKYIPRLAPRGCPAGGTRGLQVAQQIELQRRDCRLQTLPPPEVPAKH